MIAHQATGGDFDIELRAIFAQPFQKDGAVLVGEEHRLAAVATLGDVMREFGEDCPGGAGHGRSVAGFGRSLKGSVPFFQRVAPPFFTSHAVVPCSVGAKNPCPSPNLIDCAFVHGYFQDARGSRLGQVAL
jgi:hypothetical protein